MGEVPLFLMGEVPLFFMARPCRCCPPPHQIGSTNFALPDLLY